MVPRARVLLFFLAVTSLTAQTSTGNIRGTVVDATQGVVPGAKVTLTNINTGLKREAIANERGDFDAPFMPLGDYQIAAEFTGFQRKVITGVRLQVDQTAVLKIVLDAGAITQSVEVTGAAPLLDSQTSSLGQVIENKRIVDLPLNGRNPFALGLLAGGTTPFKGLNTNIPFIAGGGRHSANDILLDGVDNNIRNFGGDIGRNGVAFLPSVDAVQEFKVKTNNLAAEYGRSAGYTVNATIKGGGNDYHGSAYEFLRNDKLDANNFVSNFAGRPKSKFRQNQFGVTLGGPVRLPRYNGHDRTFFFVDYEGTRVREAASSSLSDVPPQSMRQGDFGIRPLYDPFARRLGPTGVVTSDPIPGNRIPASRLDPAALEFQKLIPASNAGGPESVNRNFLGASPRGLGRNQGDIRLDHRLFENNNLMVRVSHGRQTQPNQGVFIYSPSESVFNPTNVAISDTHILRPTVVNELRLGYNRTNVGQVPLLLAESNGFAAKNGFQSGPVIGFPSMNFTSTGDSFGQAQFTGWGAASTTLNFENSFQYADHLSISRGSHTMKMGGEARRFRFDRLPGFPMSGSYFFGPIFTANPSLTAATGHPYAEFLMGLPTRVTAQTQIDWSRQRDFYAGAYVQDDWKVTRRLTLNLGIRYDLFTQPHDQKNTGGVFDPFSRSKLGRFGVIRQPGRDGNSQSVVQGHHLNLAPRFGFAYQLTPKFVMRGGWGIFFSQREQNRQVTDIANTLTNFSIITTPNVIRETTVAPLIRLTSPLTVESALDADFSRYDARNPLGTAFLAADIGNSRFPTLHQLNYSLQYEFIPGLLVETSYAGARGLRWVQRINVNTVRFEDALAGRNTQADRPFPFVQESIGWDTAVVNNWYHSFNVRVERRYAQGLTLLGNYTISKNVDSGGSGNSLFSQQGDTRALDAYNLRLERGISPTDIPQKLVLSSLYTLPFGKGKKWLNGGVAAWVLGDWQVNGILIMRKGFPSDLRVAQRPPVFNTANRPDRVLGQPMLVANPGFDRYFNPGAFAVPGTLSDIRGNPVRMFGNAGRSILRGPGSRNLDLSLFRDIRTSETARMEFRVEAFNLSNTPTFELSGATTAPLTVGDPAFGRLTGSQTVGRQVQFGLKFLW